MRTYAHASEETLQNIQLGRNTVRGTIRCPEESTLFLSIPYSHGWKAIVDGREQEIFKAQLTFSCLLLPAGEHDIELRYTTPFFFYADIVCNIIGVLCFVGMVLVHKRRAHVSADVCYF